MYIYLISVFGSFLIYTILCIIFPPSDEEIVKKRLSKLSNGNQMDELHDQVIKERNTKIHNRNSAKFKWASKELSDAIAMSGIKLTAQEFLYVWVATTTLPVLLVIIFTGNIISSVGVGILGISIPPLLLKRSRKKRQELFTKQLGEALLIIGNCLKGGFSFYQAMESIASEMLPPISTEFAVTLREIRYGLSQEDALKHMAERIKNRDFDLFISAVLTSAQVGSNLSEILDTISSTIKDRIRIKQEVRVLTSSGRISGVIIGLLPVFLMIVIMIINPDYIALFFNSFIGNIMLVVSVILELIGFLIIKKIADINY